MRDRPCSYSVCSRTGSSRGSGAKTPICEKRAWRWRRSWVRSRGSTLTKKTSRLPSLSGGGRRGRGAPRRASSSARPPATKREPLGSFRRSIAGPIPAGLLGAPVDQLPELLAGLEVRDLLGGDHHPRPGLRVPPRPAVAAPDAEAPEAPELDLVALLEGVDDRGEDGFHDDLG